MIWYGADPGGEKCFGLATLHDDGTYQTSCVSSVNECVERIGSTAPIGIDCPLWWSPGRGGGRKVDGLLRRKYRIRSGTIQSVNSLRGAAVVQGMLLAMRLREKYPKIIITETHPKALIAALQLNSWNNISARFNLKGAKPGNEHERDALLGAVAAREGSQSSWKIDLTNYRNEDELDPKHLWFGEVSYWWPEDINDSL